MGRICEVSSATVGRAERVKPTYAHMVLPIVTKFGTLTCMGSVVFMCPDV